VRAAAAGRPIARASARCAAVGGPAGEARAAPAAVAGGAGTYRLEELELTGAALDLARSVVRRAERRTVALSEAGELPDSHVLAYLNRLADLLFVMARAADGGFLPLRTRE